MKMITSIARTKKKIKKIRVIKNNKLNIPRAKTYSIETMQTSAVKIRQNI